MPNHDLTRREMEIGALMAAGYSNKQIAEELIVEVSTVASHLFNLYGKLDAHSRIEAARRFKEVCGEEETIERLRYDVNRTSQQMQSVRREITSMRKRLAEIDGVLDAETRTD